MGSGSVYVVCVVSVGLRLGYGWDGLVLGFGWVDIRIGSGWGWVGLNGGITSTNKIPMFNAFVQFRHIQFGLMVLGWVQVFFRVRVGMG